MSSKKTSLATPFHLTAQKALGQNFLKDPDIVKSIVNAAHTICPQKKCIEIGPGSGALTQELLEQGWHVIAIEKDNRAVVGLENTLAKNWNSQLIIKEQDVLTWRPSDLATEQRLCLGNLPYYISSPILLWFIENRKIFSHGIFMLQEEVVDRLVAQTSTKAYGRLSVRVQLAFHVKKLFRVEAHCFVPKPQVNSAIVQLTPSDFDFSSQQDENNFENFTNLLFSNRRKMLRRIFGTEFEKHHTIHDNAIAHFWEIAATHGIQPQMRPEELSPAATYKLHQELQKLRQSV